MTDSRTFEIASSKGFVPEPLFVVVVTRSRSVNVYGASNQLGLTYNEAVRLRQRICEENVTVTENPIASAAVQPLQARKQPD